MVGGEETNAHRRAHAATWIKRVSKAVVDCRTLTEKRVFHEVAFSTDVIRGHVIHISTLARCLNRERTNMVDRLGFFPYIDFWKIIKYHLHLLPSIIS